MSGPRRRFVTATAVAAVVLAGVVPAHAGELSDVLERVDDAVYSGRQMVVTEWNGVSRLDVFSVEHARGVTVVDIDGTRSAIAPGRVRSGTEHAVTFVEWSVGGPEADRYRVVDGGRAKHLGRIGDVVGVMEGDLLRMRLVIDRQTGAPLLTQVYDDEGNVFRYASMVEFRPYTTERSMSEATAGDYEVMTAAEAPLLPRKAGGYERSDSYVGPEGAEQGFFTDGLFSFSLFRLDGVHDIAKLAQGSPRVVGGARYMVAVAPSELWVLWNSPDATFVLVGDLPPDHLEAVLADLPRPGSRSFLSRIWHGIFG